MTDKEMEYRVELSNEQVFCMALLICSESLGSCTGPIQEFGDDGFMIWMVGSIVHLFSIGITFSALWQPISTLHGVGKGLCVQQAKSFHSYELLGPLLPSQQLTYLGLHSPFTSQPCNTKVQEKQRLEGLRCHSITYGIYNMQLVSF
ncbi:uncharacterized protein LOC126585034 [Malus sylvestris]|uniref:uncharacterized protein LOC126585034 n=1 Tax=Malus sylvestris TaxID=3752 RepID=UPI0021AD1CED|nr:uncharacterized protein LOC126585034 [Malus sylvestris]